MPSRRAFLKQSAIRTLQLAAAANALSVAAAESDPVLIIDTHTHFYDPMRPQGVPWPDKKDALLYRKVYPSDYKVLRKPQPVAGTVVIEASAWLEDNQWILDLAAKEKLITGFVGHLNPGSPGFEQELNRFSKNKFFRGIRIGSDRLHAGLAKSDFARDIASLAARDLSLDLVGGPDLLGPAAQLARDNPRLRIVIDHLAGLRIDGREPDAAWQEAMKRVSEYPAVYCKVSGLVEGTGRDHGDAPADVNYYAPVLDKIWSWYGPDRLVYGSNWPVSERFASCYVVQKIVYDYFRTKGRKPLENVFARNARAAYKWVDR